MSPSVLRIMASSRREEASASWATSRRCAKAFAVVLVVATVESHFRAGSETPPIDWGTVVAIARVFIIFAGIEAGFAIALRWRASRLERRAERAEPCRRHYWVRDSEGGTQCLLCLARKAGAE